MTSSGASLAVLSWYGCLEGEVSLLRVQPYVAVGKQCIHIWHFGRQQEPERTQIALTGFSASPKPCAASAPCASAPGSSNLCQQPHTLLCPAPSLALVSEFFSCAWHTHAHTHTQVGCSSCHLTSPCPPAESPRTAVVGQLFHCRVKPV